MDMYSFTFRRASLHRLHQTTLWQKRNRVYHWKTYQHLWIVFLFNRHFWLGSTYSIASCRYLKIRFFNQILIWQCYKYIFTKKASPSCIRYSNHLTVFITVNSWWPTTTTGLIVQSTLTIIASSFSNSHNHSRRSLWRQLFPRRCLSLHSPTGHALLRLPLYTTPTDVFPEI